MGALLEAVGTDLRDQASASAQLVADTDAGRLTSRPSRYHRGRAEVQGFAVADKAVVGDVAGAARGAALGDAGSADPRC